MKALCETNPEACATAQAALEEAGPFAYERFGERARQHNEDGSISGDYAADAVTHCVWQGLTTLRTDADFARQAGEAYEKDNTDATWVAKRNLHNNAAGREIAAKAAGDEAAVFEACAAGADNGALDIAKWQVL